MGGTLRPMSRSPGFGNGAGCSKGWPLRNAAYCGRKSVGVAGSRSDRRLAARPVGAHRANSTRLAPITFRTELTSVVLPTPGPPVMTSTVDRNASRSASCWLSAKASPVRPSTHGMALSASIGGQGGAPRAKQRRRSAITCSARYSLARNTHRRPSSVSATTSPASNSRNVKWARMRGLIAAEPKCSSAGQSFSNGWHAHCW